MKILLIEDDTDIASNIGQYFEDKDRQLDFAYNGAHGLAMALAERFDLVPNPQGGIIARVNFTG